MNKLLAILYYILAIEGFAQEYESYLSRPDILELSPKSHDIGPGWEKMKRGHIELVAQALGLYPEHQIYFLARDAELLYDQARVLLQDNPEELERIHLLNISRANMRKDGVKDYLVQEGISKKTLEQGKKILFVDTGFSGTIPNVIVPYFPSQYHSQFSSHLMASSNPSHPSSRVFLSWITQKSSI